VVARAIGIRPSSPRTASVARFAARRTRLRNAPGGAFYAKPTYSGAHAYRTLCTAALTPVILITSVMHTAVTSARNARRRGGLARMRARTCRSLRYTSSPMRSRARPMDGRAYACFQRVYAVVNTHRRSRLSVTSRSVGARTRASP